METVLAYFKMGSKYDIPRLRQEAVWRLERCYPSTTLDAYKSRSEPRPIVLRKGEVYEVALLALREYNSLHQLLPAALYKCCTVPDLERIIRASSVFVEQPSAALQSEFWKKMYFGRSKLQISHLDDTFWYLDGELSELCTRKTKCTATMKTMQAEAPHDILKYSPTALSSFSTLNPDAADDACADCVAHWKSRHEEGRRRVWAKLREIFDIPVPDDGFV
ncbi:hypothetical protein FA95DRAFT_1311361 [Auriscalpium vulgare]|uniref:Uncharacterized protein n=1 Tax=Auriscalpium vulgare TaxID=40419 RepID=A0ACB8RSP7_9AGAM|nr:hypothetical protein FA95DRAFT_1311361 [Auriscalpium vulgare]